MVGVCGVWASAVVVGVKRNAWWVGFGGRACSVDGISVSVDGGRIVHGVSATSGGSGLHMVSTSATQRW